MGVPFLDTLTLGQSGNAVAIEELFARWRPLLRMQASQLLGPELSARVDPSDVVQDSLSQAFSELDQFRGQKQAEWVAWLQCLVVGHANKTRRFHHAAKRDPAKEEASPETFIGNQTTPEAQGIELEEAARLAEAIEQLPHAMRVAIVHRVFFDRSWAEVAETLGKSPGAARVLWTRGLKKLRNALVDD